MKPLRLAIALCFGLCASGLARAEAPETLSYSGRLTSTDDETIPDGRYVARFRLWDAARGGMELWLEQQTIFTRDGTFNAELGGAGMPLDERLFADLDALWLEIEIDGDVLSPRVRVNSVPWAVRARSAGSADAVACGGCIGAGVVDNSAIQLRVDSQCGVGSAIRAIRADGTVECQAASSMPYSAGAGLALEGSTFSLASASGPCTDGQVLKYSAANADWRCGDSSGGGGGGLAASDVENACFVRSGCAQPIYLGKTKATFTGAMGGYTALHGRCQVQYPGSKACSAADIMTAHACNEPSLTLIPSDFSAWYADGTSHGECEGFQSGASESWGRAWVGPRVAGEGHAAAVSCSSELPILCCRL